MSHPLPGQSRKRVSAEERAARARVRAQDLEDALTDLDGYYHGHTGKAPAHVIDDEVPDNAHWKGWVW